ncbi:hypothetical protein DPMN_165200 [Dreissena polymorpha]|uniref:Uncharacterized protein n=1 Tax=Dreissena polymorpha TaxID=45954 RepID=A0A9D4EWE0_DREPO|nr:hypothetical protein DPMN_165200 [Dreissena polymorpha]
MRTDGPVSRKPALVDFVFLSMPARDTPLRERPASVPARNARLNADKSPSRRAKSQRIAVW